MYRLPPWIRSPLKANTSSSHVHSVLANQGLNTVCQSARCPNRQECYSSGTATFMILGDICTRHCAFCGVGTGMPQPPVSDEPNRVAIAAKALGLKHVVVTSVTRDDLPDGGASVFAETIGAIKGLLPETKVEVLIPDFKGESSLIDIVAQAAPDVFSHNLETVSRLQKTIRPAASYKCSLTVLQWAAANYPTMTIKSGLMLGLGETDQEIEEAMADLRSAGCTSLTLGQYLRPSRESAPVARFVPPSIFNTLADKARTMGFRAVAAGPLVRSSYHAAELACEHGKCIQTDPD